MSDIKTSGHSKAERGRVRIVEGGGSWEVEPPPSYIINPQLMLLEVPQGGRA